MDEVVYIIWWHGDNCPSILNEDGWSRPEAETFLRDMKDRAGNEYKIIPVGDLGRVLDAWHSAHPGFDFD